MRKTAIALFCLVLLSTLAAGQVPTAGNVFFGYSYYHTDLSTIDKANTNGWQASLEGKFLPWVGIVADFGSHYGSQNFPVFCEAIIGCSPVVNANVHEYNILFGPRVSVSVGRFRPFAEGMIGAGHVTAKGIASDTSFASALGGGIDYKLIPAVAWRFQGDFVNTRFFSRSQNNLQLATGIVIRF